MAKRDGISDDRSILVHSVSSPYYSSHKERGILMDSHSDEANMPICSQLSSEVLSCVFFHRPRYGQYKENRRKLLHSKNNLAVLTNNVSLFHIEPFEISLLSQQFVSLGVCDNVFVRSSNHHLLAFLTYGFHIRKPLYKYIGG